MWATLRQRDFSLLWFAGLISITGNWMLFIALPVLVYEMTGSALAVGGMLVANTLPGILFGSVAGVFVDRWERRRTIIIVNLLLALSILPLLLVRSADWLWLVYVVSFMQSTLGRFFAPAENAMLPLLSKPELLVSANALNALNNNLARLIGPALGGVIVAASGVNGVVVVDALTYVIAAGLAALISVTSHPGKDQTANISPQNIAAEWADSLRLIWRERNVRVLFLVSALPAIGEATMYVLFVPFVTEILRGDTTHVGALMSAQAVGGIIGGMVIGWVARRVLTVRLLGVSAIVFGLVDLALFNYSTFFTGITLAYVLFVLAGPLAVAMGASYDTLLQSNVDDAYRGRVFGTIGLTNSIFMLVGVAFAGAAGDTLGIVPAINVQGYVYILAGVICLLALRQPAPVVAQQ
jgi:predicted MFS family arabinose efflux permease